MADRRLLLLAIYVIDLCAVGVVNLREVKVVTSGIMGTEAGKRASAGALDYFYIGVAFGKLGAGSIEILYFNPEMIDSGAPSGTARYEGDTDVTIANGNRASFSISVARYVHVEIGPVEHAERRVIVSRNRKMIKLG